MKYKAFFLPFAFIFLSFSSFGQIEKTIHQAFELEGISSVQLALYGTYSIVPWAGNNILIETKIQLYNSSESVLKHFVDKDKRYLIEADTVSAGSLKLFSHDMKRPSLRTKTGAESLENVETRIFIPENFVVKDEKTLVLDEARN